MTSRSWKVLSRTDVFDALPWVHVSREAVQLPGGTIIPDFYQIELSDFVTVTQIKRMKLHGLLGLNPETAVPELAIIHS